jgi:hypothetical protein
MTFTMTDLLRRRLPLGPFHRMAWLAPVVAAGLAACGGEEPAPEQPQQAESAQPRARALAVTVNPAGWVSVPAPTDALLQGLAIPASAPTQGMWSAVGPWPMNGLHQAVLPDGKVLTWGTTPDGNVQNGRYFDVWDPNRGLFDGGAHVTTYDPARQDSFCAAATYLPGGQLLITGGNGNVTSVAYNPGTGAMPSAGNVADSRWYATMITLADGRPIIVGGIAPYTEGQWTNVAGALTEGLSSMTPEVYENGAWRTLLNAQSRTAWGPDALRASIPKAWLAPDGRVFGVSTDQMWYVDANAAGGQGTTTIAGAWKAVPSGAFTNDNAPNSGPTSTGVMYAPGRVLMVGGNAYQNGNGFAGSRQATVIDLNGGGAVRTEQPLMNFGRHYAGVVVLPDGQVVVTGGETRANNDPAFGAYTAEMWNPATGTWSRMAASTVFRGYHSQAGLLPNGTVLVTGGGTPGPIQLRGDVFYPPYLFRTVNGTAQLAPRPRLVGISGLSHAHGAQLQFDLASTATIREAVLIGLSAGTHSFNSGQRRIPMAFTQDQFRITATVPTNTLVPPGYYQLVAVDANGVPSRGTIVAVGQGVSAPQVPVTPYTPPDTGTSGAVTPPAGALACAAEGQICTPPSGDTATVWFGADTRWVSRTGVTGPLACTVATFGDPAPGTVKSCVAVTTSTLVGSWNFDAVSGATAPDSSAGNRPLTLANTTLVAGRAGGQAVQFNGANASGSTAGPLLDTAGSFSVATWVRMDALTGWRTMVNQDGSVASGFWLQYSEFVGNKFLLSMHDADAGDSAPFRAVGTTTPVVGRWYHVVGVRDRAAGTMRLYVDGRLEATTAYTGGWAATGSFNIGRGRFGGPNDWLAGALDDVRAFNTALTDAQVTALYTTTTPPPAGGGTPVGSWNFDAASGATAPDSSAGNRPLTLNASGSTAGPLLDTAGSFSVATWVRMDALTGWRTMVNQDGSVASGFWLQYSEFVGNKFLLSMHDADAGDSAPFRAVGTTTPVVGRWYHVVGVRDRAAGTMRLYVDGRLEATTAYTGGWAATGSFNIGRGRFGGPNDWLAGALDDVQAYTAALTDAQVAELYSAASTGPVTIPAITAPPINFGGTATYTVAAQAGVTYSWDFGDGSPATPFSASASITRTFANPGIYAVTLTARDSAGRTTTRRNATLWVVNPDNDTVSVFDTATNGPRGRDRRRAPHRARWRAPRRPHLGQPTRARRISIVSPTTLAVVQTVACRGLAALRHRVRARRQRLRRARGHRPAAQARRPAAPRARPRRRGPHPATWRHHRRRRPGAGLALHHAAAARRGTANVRTTARGAPGRRGGGRVDRPMAVLRTIVLATATRSDTRTRAAASRTTWARRRSRPTAAAPGCLPSRTTSAAARCATAARWTSRTRCARSARASTWPPGARTGRRIDHDNASLASAAAYHPSGAYLFVALETSRQVAVVDPSAGASCSARGGPGAAGRGRLARRHAPVRAQLHGPHGQRLRPGAAGAPKGASQRVAGPSRRPHAGTERWRHRAARQAALLRRPRPAPGARRLHELRQLPQRRRRRRPGVGPHRLRRRPAQHHQPARPRRHGARPLHWSANFDEVQDFEGQIRTWPAAPA